jgi:crotonobetainyl-CoA:carnitine CoA-transferase CaiB-like acyl-CoA transferase
MAAGAIVEVEEIPGTARQIANPVEFHGSVCASPGRSPELGEHTDQILAELAADSTSWPSHQMASS